MVEPKTDNVKISFSILNLFLLAFKICMLLSKQVQVALKQPSVMDNNN